jgi:hypothetical protein
MPAKKKKEEKKVEAPVVPTFIGDYDWKWMSEQPDHPDHKKVMKEARKKKYI